MNRPAPTPRPSSRTRQGGHVALLLALSIVIVVSMISAGVVEVGIGEARRIAHELRRQEAQAVAESALDRAAVRLRLEASHIRGIEPNDWMEPGRERWVVCDDAVPRPPCLPAAGAEQESFDTRWSTYGPLPHLFAPQEPLGSRATAYYLARTERAGEPMPGWSTLHVVAEGRSRDGSGVARLRRSYQLRPLVWRLPAAPLVSSGAANLVGGVWLTTEDDVPAPPVAATDALALLFGPAGADPSGLRAVARPHENCDALGPDTRGLVWVAGDCVVPTERVIGSADRPVVLVVDSGVASLLAPTELFGILVLRSRADGSTALRQANGSSTLHGALVADDDLEIVAENLAIRHEPTVLQPLLGLAGPLAEVPGSWTDHR